MSHRQYRRTAARVDPARQFGVSDGSGLRVNILQNGDTNQVVVEGVQCVLDTGSDLFSFVGGDIARAMETTSPEGLRTLQSPIMVTVGGGSVVTVTHRILLKLQIMDEFLSCNPVEISVKCYVLPDDCGSLPSPGSHSSYLEARSI